VHVSARRDEDGTISVTGNDDVVGRLGEANEDLPVSRDEPDPDLAGRLSPLPLPSGFV